MRLPAARSKANGSGTDLESHGGDSSSQEDLWPQQERHGVRDHLQGGVGEMRCCEATARNSDQLQVWTVTRADVRTGRHTGVNSHKGWHSYWTTHSGRLQVWTGVNSHTGWRSHRETQQPQVRMWRAVGDNLSWCQGLSVSVDQSDSIWTFSLSVR